MLVQNLLHMESVHFDVFDLILDDLANALGAVLRQSRERLLKLLDSHFKGWRAIYLDFGDQCQSGSAVLCVRIEAGVSVPVEMNIRKFLQVIEDAVADMVDRITVEGDEDQHGISGEQIIFENFHFVALQVKLLQLW